MGFFKSIGNIAKSVGDAVTGKGVAGAIVNPVGALARSVDSSAGSVFGNFSQYAPVLGGAALGSMFGNPMMGAQIGAGIYGGQMAARSQADANAMNVALAEQQMMFSAQQAQNQMNFQQNMSDTAISRAKADMIRAGINPMLAPGSQMSTPSGAMGSYTPARVDPVPSVAMSALSSAQQGMRMFQDIAEAKSRIRANAARAGVDTATADEKSFWATLSRSTDDLFKNTVNSGKDLWNKVESWREPGAQKGWRTLEVENAERDYLGGQ